MPLVMHAGMISVALLANVCVASTISVPVSEFGGAVQQPSGR